MKRGRVSHKIVAMVIVIVGAAGAGKTTIGQSLAMELGWPFVERDDVHATIVRAIDRREPTVVACSTLAARSFEALRGDLRGVRCVFLRTTTPPAPDEPAAALTVNAASPPEEILSSIRREFGV